MELKHKKSSFVDSKGVTNEYDYYYVVFNGVEIRLTPNDSTGKQLLKIVYSEKEGTK